MTARAPLVFGSDGLSQQLQAADSLAVPALHYAGYFNAGATTAPNWTNGGAQYCTVSTTVTISPTNAQTGARYALVVKNTSASSVTVTIGKASMAIAASAAFFFDLFYTGSTYLRSNAVASAYTYP